MDVPRYGSSRRPSAADLVELRQELDAIRASVLGKAERRLRGLTPSERQLLEAGTAQLVEEVWRLLQGERDAIAGQ
jgi:hypothetical protein